MKRYRALIVGDSLEEIQALRATSTGMVGRDAPVIALEASRNSADMDLIWSTHPVKIYELTDTDHREPGVLVEEFCSDDADVWKVIVDAAHRYEVDVIVIAGHRRGWLRRLVSGSAARDLLNHSDVPILAMPEAALNVAPSPAR